LIEEIFSLIKKINTNFDQHVSNQIFLKKMKVYFKE